MRFRIETKNNDGKAEAPAMEIDVGEMGEYDLTDVLMEEVVDDSGKVIPVGSTILIERVE